MSKVERFEDLIAWQKARVLTRDIYAITREGSFTRDFGLSSQIQRAAVSIMSNIAEGFERSSARDRLHFFIMAKSSCAEVRSQLYVALDVNYISHEQFETLSAQAEETSRILGKLCSVLAKRAD